MSRRRMYNAVQKQNFIAETIDNEYTMRSVLTLFYKIAPYEEELGKDCSTMEQEELERTLSSVVGAHISTQYTRISFLRAYMHWCVEKGFPDAREYNEIRIIKNTGRKKAAVEDHPVELSRLNVFLVRNPLHLQRCMDQVFDPESDETQDNVYRCFLWLAYGGMSEQTAFSLEAADVDPGRLEAMKGDEAAILYRQAMPSVLNCMRLTQFRYRNVSYVNAGDIYRQRVPGTRLLRGIRADQNMLNFRSQLSRRLRQQKASKGAAISMLSYKKVLTSGVFYRMHEAEQAGIEPNFKALAMEVSEKCGMSAQPNLLRRDYERWKAAGQS